MQRISNTHTANNDPEIDEIDDTHDIYINKLRVRTHHKNNFEFA